ncbi:transposase, partial [Escherichia coli]
TADRNRSHWSTSKTPSYTKSVSWQHHPFSNEIMEEISHFYINMRITAVSLSN